MHTNDKLETRIIEAAKHLFIENGFAKTSMSDIAASAGINRPALHYYYRTKDKMFQAVFGNIVLSFVPHIQNIILQSDKPLSDRIGEVVDAYYHVFLANPCLPLFMVGEIHRDIDHLSSTAKELHLEEYFKRIVGGLQGEMDAGKIKSIPLPFVFYTFYGLLTIPFLTKNMGTATFLKDLDAAKDFEQMLVCWKPHVVKQMETLLLY